MKQLEKLNIPADQTFFVAVYSYGGIISSADVGNDIVSLWSAMKNNLKANFNGEEDDARIFNEKGEEVYSYNEDEDLVELFCPSCQLILSRFHFEGTRCNCLTEMRILTMDEG